MTPPDPSAPASTPVVVDTSAMVAVLRHEPGWQWLTDRLEQAVARYVAAPIALEFGIVSEANAPTEVNVASRFLRDAMIEIVAFDADLYDRAMDGWRRFGKGRHPASLNFGDCCTYALADRANLPILCVGDDFARTDMAVLQPVDH